MSSTRPTVQPVRGTTSSALLTGLFLGLAVLLFALIYLIFPANQHYGALLTIGVLSIVFALASYLAESLSREPSAQRSLAWGFFGMGFTVLYLSVGLAVFYSVSGVSVLGAFIGIIVITVFLVIAVVGIIWRIRAVRATQNQMVSRASWQREPAPSAFSYGAANSPSVPTVAPPPSTPPANPPRSP
jgi:MFS family permease